MSGAGFFALSAAGDPFSVVIPETLDTQTGATTVEELVSATIVGGIGPFSYAWAVYGDLGVSVVDPSVNPVTVRAIGLMQGEPKFGTLAVSVTDAASGATVTSNSCFLTFTRV